VSALFGVVVQNDDAGIRQDNDLFVKRSAERGRDWTSLSLWSGDQSRFDEAGKAVKPSLLASPHYSFIGCCFGMAVGQSLANAGPFQSRDGHWSVVIDGIISGFPGQDIADALAQNGPSFLASLTGQFALIARWDRSEHLYWAARAKPLYGLYNGSVLRIASRLRYFDGFYHPVRSPGPISLGPYEHGVLTPEGLLDSRPYLDRNEGSGSLVLAGGGLDTLVAAWDNQMRFPKDSVTLLHVDYGAKAAECEWQATQKLAHALTTRFDLPVKCARVPLQLLPAHTYSALVPGSQEVSKQPVSGKASEWVPGRNTLLMAIALSYAESNDQARIVCGINQEAAIAYPDNEGEWLDRWRQLVPYALSTERSIELCAPVAGLTKTEIVKLGERLKIPWARAASWSCYEGGELHCGLCSSCRCRRLAFKRARVSDPTRYAAEI
jgi:7-cyano-7-deazaguanine synthase